MDSVNRLLWELDVTKIEKRNGRVQDESAANRSLSVRGIDRDLFGGKG